ncbi:uncharacterized protein HKW66_Vig0174370 [Vigna angularis]|uniref:Uncharacterized protein n=1 Tax=Phaseolus angularis TaxID=3914 RepID=A0A8T0JLS4_PHAAN|nr:uncharacterized protein HKW66_Vig0174370 [Vigna angularis]
MPVVEFLNWLVQCSVVRRRGRDWCSRSGSVRRRERERLGEILQVVRRRERALAVILWWSDEWSVEDWWSRGGVLVLWWFGGGPTMMVVRWWSGGVTASCFRFDRQLTRSWQGDIEKVCGMGPLNCSATGTPSSGFAWSPIHKECFQKAGFHTETNPPRLSSSESLVAYDLRDVSCRLKVKPSCTRAPCHHRASRREGPSTWPKASPATPIIVEVFADHCATRSCLLSCAREKHRFSELSSTMSFRWRHRYPSRRFSLLILFRGLNPNTRVTAPTAQAHDAAGGTSHHQRVGRVLSTAASPLSLFLWFDLIELIRMLMIFVIEIL